MSRVSIKKQNNGGAPLPKDKNIILMKVSDLLDGSLPARDADGVTITGNIALKVGVEALGLETTSKSIARNDNSDGETDAKGWIQNLSFIHPGDSKEVNAFVAEWLNEEIIAISKDCGDGKGTRLHGTVCNPLEMTVEEQDDQEGIAKTITLTSSQRGQYKSAHYTGTLPTLAGAGSSQGGI